MSQSKKSRKAATGVAIKKARNGRGVFAARDFTTGEKILEVKGTYASGYVEDDLDENTRNNLIRYDRRRYISPVGEQANFLNHSCAPNAGVVKRKGVLSVVALDAIPKGSEITFDYSTVTADDDIWEMNCNCGEKDCRKRIRKFSSLPQRIREKYIALRVVPKYIRNI